MSILSINLNPPTSCNNPSHHCAFLPRWDPLNTPRAQLLFFQFPSNCGFPQYDSLQHQIPFFPDFPALFDSSPLWWGFGRKWDGAGAVAGSWASSFGFLIGTRGWLGSSQRCGWTPPDPFVKNISSIIKSETWQRNRRFLFFLIPFLYFLPLSTQTSGAIHIIQ